VSVYAAIITLPQSDMIVCTFL